MSYSEPRGKFNLSFLQIFFDQSSIFRLNFSFSFLLEKTYPDDGEDFEQEEDRIRCFLANHHAFTYFDDAPPLIIDQKSLDTALALLNEDDLKEHCSLKRESTRVSWPRFLQKILEKSLIF